MSAPKFKLSILGVLKGFNHTTVRKTLVSRMKMEPEQVEKLLQNQAAVSKKLMAHKDAFTLQSTLREVGVDCVIKPAPLEGLAERAGTLQLNADAKPKPVSRTPVVRSPRPSSVRTGRAAARASSTKGSVSMWPVAAVVALVMLASWLFDGPQPGGLEPGGTSQMASMLDRPIN